WTAGRRGAEFGVLLQGLAATRRVNVSSTSGSIELLGDFSLNDFRSAIASAVLPPRASSTAARNTRISSGVTGAGPFWPFQYSCFEADSCLEPRTPTTLEPSDVGWLARRAV